jgi:hypothetical protein
MDADTVEIMVGGRLKVMNAFQRWMMCGRKIAYGSLSAATETAERLDHAIYHCPLCCDWHTTRQKSSRLNQVYFAHD